MNAHLQTKNLGNTSTPQGNIATVTETVISGRYRETDLIVACKQQYSP